MKKLCHLLSMLLVFGALTLRAQTPTPLKKVMELKMPKTIEDDMPGTRGASVAWHPVQKKYYACFAGNAEYPLAVFDATGKRLSKEDQTAILDTRGLWYNPATKLICGNGHGDLGWFTYILDKAGIPTDITMITNNQHQPGLQSVGVFNSLDKQVLFLNGSQVYMYESDGTLADSMMIHWTRKKTDGVDEDEDPTLEHEDFNIYSLVYTGIKGQELGFLNITNKQVELYDIKTGFQTKVLNFPETAVVEQTFNFAYANGIYWLFNIELRKWVGYK